MAHDFKAVIFDFDGVIVDSLSVHFRAWRQATREIFGHSIEEFEKSLAGRSTSSIARIICQNIGVSQKGDGTHWVEKLAARKRQILSESSSEIMLIKGVKEILSTLEALNIPYGIGSNAPRKFIEFTLHSHGIFVKNIVALEDVPRPKPAPDMFLKLAAELGVSHPHHSHVAVFEDSTHGITAACAAGMTAIGVSTQHDEATLRKAGCLFVVSDHFESLRLFTFQKNSSGSPEKVKIVT